MIDCKGHVEAIYANPYSAKAAVQNELGCCSAEIDIYSVEEVITQICWRKYHVDRGLRGASGGNGAVAEHVIIKTAQSGHMRNIHEMEIAAYKNHNIVEVHLDAMDDGLFVWPYFGFHFANKGDEERIKGILFIRYLYEVIYPNNMTKAINTAKKCKTFEDMKPYCQMKNKKSYTEYLKENLPKDAKGKLISIQMYKEV